MSCICFFCHSAQQSLQISLATRVPSSFGTGAKPSGSAFRPQRVHSNFSPKIAMLALSAAKHAPEHTAQATALAGQKAVDVLIIRRGNAFLEDLRNGLDRR